MEKGFGSRTVSLSLDYVKKQIACQSNLSVSGDLEAFMICLKFSGSVSPSVLMTMTEQSDSFIRSRIGLKVSSRHNAIRPANPEAPDSPDIIDSSFPSAL